MPELTIKVTKKHVELAKKARSEGGWVSRCCVVYQACKAAGIPIDSVGLDRITLEDGRDVLLPPSASQITRVGDWEWDKVHPMEFKLTIPD